MCFEYNPKERSYYYNLIKREEQKARPYYKGVDYFNEKGDKALLFIWDASDSEPAYDVIPYPDGKIHRAFYTDYSAALDYLTEMGFTLTASPIIVGTASEYIAV